MRFVVVVFVALFALIHGTVGCGQSTQLPTPASRTESPLRLSEPVEAVVADLRRYIPEYRRRQNIPGVAIALIRGGKIVWIEGFGVANTITAQPVTPQTVFEAASNSKVVTAYIALRLVDTGRLSLDKPLNAYLPEPWLPPSEYRDAITLRHVLSHSSGLGHNTLSRGSLFAPGRGYSYSGIGFLYLQAVIEEVTGRSLEEVARQMVFAPLGMSSSSFVNPVETRPRVANGHVHAIVPAVLFELTYAACVVIIGLPGLMVLRIRRGHWQPPRRMVVGALAVAYPLSLLPAFVLLGKVSLVEFAWLIALCGLILATAFAVIFLAGRVLILRLCPERPRLRIALIVVWSLLTMVGLTLLGGRVTNLPVPKWPTVQANAAASLRATAGDLATFLIELSDPQYLSADMAAQLRTPQIRLSDDLSWGLGPGIQHGQEGDALWQWGQNIDFQSVMIIYPEYGFGAVVLTNNDLLNPDVAIEIAHRALGGKMDSIRPI